MGWLRAFWSGLPYDPEEPRPCPRCEATITWGDSLCSHCGLILRPEGRRASPARGAAPEPPGGRP